MKKNVIIALIGIVLVTLLSCGEKIITVKGADGTEYESYQECCAAQDFQAAHQYLAKLENSEIGGYYDAKEYVFKQEALYLMSIGDEAAKKRLIFLLKENNDNINDHVTMLIDLSIDNDDEAFVKALANQYNSDVKKDDLKKVVEYLSHKDVTGNSEYLITLLKSLKAARILLDYAISSGNMELVKKVAPQCLNIQDSDLITQLASLKNKEISDDIIKAVSQVTISGRPMSKGLHDFYDGCRDCHVHKEVAVPHFKYTDGIVDFNNDCDRILDIALGASNQYLAQKILVCFKQNIETMLGSGKAPDGTKVDGNHCYVYYTNVDKNNAQKKYQEAVRSGAFK